MLDSDIGEHNFAASPSFRIQIFDSLFGFGAALNIAAQETALHT
jgi:hypothetical protein